MGCDRCDYTEGGVAVDALGHTELSEKAPAVAPTCTEAGKTAVMGCDRCDYTEGGVAVDALGHKPGEAVKENEKVATCTATGSYDNVVYCATCGEELSRETITVDALGHKLVVTTPAVDATCTTAGKTAAKSCENCDYTEASQTVAALGHTGATHGVWNEELGYYESNATCTNCGQKYDFGCTVGYEAEDMSIGEHGWNTAPSTGTEGDISYATVTKKADQVFTAGKFRINPEGVATGKYMVIRYRVHSETATMFTIKYTGGDTFAYVDVNNDGEWHTAIVELGSDFGTGDTRLMLYHNGGSNKGWAAGDSLDIDWVYMYDSVDRIPASVLEGYVCDHSLSTTPLAVYEVVGDGSGQEYRATCDLCGAKCGRAAITTKVQNPDAIVGTNETIQAIPDRVVNGWIVMTGGLGKVELVLVDVETGEEARIVVDATYDANLQNNSYVMSGGYEVTGTPSTYRYNFTDLGLDLRKIETIDGTIHDFSGGKVTLAVNLYSLADPTAPAIRTECWKRTVTVEKHEHTVGEATETNRIEATCIAAGSYKITTACTVCGDVLDEQTVVIPATGKHIGATHGVWNAELGYYESNVACTGCNDKYNFGCTVGGEAEKIFTNLNQWNLNRTVEQGFVKFTKNGDATFTATYFAINPEGVATGKYMVIRYRVNSETAELITIRYTNASDMAYVEVDNDGEWHTAIVKLGSDFTNGDVRLCLYHVGGGAPRGWAAGDSLDVDWVYMFEDPTRIPAELLEGFVCEHTGATHGIWNDELGYYESNATCTNCGQKYDFGGTIGGEAEKIFTNLNQWNLSRTVKDGFVEFKKNNGELFCATYININPAGAVTGDYMLIKFRANSAAATSFCIKNNTTSVQVLVPIGTNVDEDGWQIAIVKIEGGITGDNNRLCLYNVNASSSLGWAEGETLDVDWVYMFEAVDRIPAELLEGFVCEHVGATHGVWNDELGYYESNATCTNCGQKYDFGGTVGGEAEKIFTNLNQWNLSRTVEQGFVKFTKNKDETFTATYFDINPEGVATGKYMVIRYRVHSEAATMFTIRYASGETYAYVDVDNDGEWHTAIVELGSDFATGDVRLMLYHNGGSTKGWAAGDSLDIDWVYMYDSLDRIPEEISSAA